MLRRAAVLAVIVAPVLLGRVPTLAQTTGGDRLVIVTLRDQPALGVATSDPSPAPGTLRGMALDIARGNRDRRVFAAATSLARAGQDALASRIVSLGGRVVYRAGTINAVAVRIPADALDQLRARPEVASVEEDVPADALLDVVGATMGVSAFWTAGYTGGSTDVAVIDTGVYIDHEAFLPRRASVQPGRDSGGHERAFHDAAQAFSAGQYCDDPASADDFGGHGTYVAGMIFSQGAGAAPARKGISYGIDLLYNLKAGFAVCGGGGASYLTDLMAAVDWSLSSADPPEVYNYSYGATAGADDDSYARFWDALVDTYAKVATVSAGNSGSNFSNPARGTVNSPGIAYNVISVANAYDGGDASRTSDTIAASSSRGPTPGGRKKPDLAAPGTSVALPSNLWPVGWSSVTGTSFSSPAIAGAAALLMNAGVTDPRAVKAVLINTADDYGAPGWDQQWGWGYYNGAEAFAARTSVLLTTIAPQTSSGLRLFERTSSKATKATIVWNRHVTYVPGGAIGTPTDLNDADLYLYSAATGEQRAASVSTIDNVEQVTGSSIEPAVVAIRAGTFRSGSSETVALAHSGGFVARSGPAPQVAVSAPGTVMPASTFAASATIANAGDVAGHQFQATLTLPAGYALASGTATVAVGSIAPGAVATVTWQVRAPGTATAPASLSVSASTSSYGGQWVGSGAAAVGTSSGCAYTVAPGAMTIDAPGGAPAVSIAAGDGCTWTASSGTAWIVVTSGASGSGSGAVTLSVSPNTAAAARTGTIMAAGQQLSLLQAGNSVRSYSLAEGATGGLFDYDLAIANPETAAAPIRVRYLRESLAPIEQTYTVAAQSRTTIDIGTVPGMTDGPVSVVVESLSGTPLAVERTMSWTRGQHYGGHGGAAVDTASRTWYFAEGSQGLFDTWLLLANPDTAPATVTVTFLRETGGPVVASYVVDGGRRKTIFAGDIAALRNTSFGITVEATAPIIAERAMYWTNSSVVWTGGHESAGASTLSTSWLLAEGATGAYFDTYVLVGNPNDVTANVTLTYLLDTGASIVRTRAVGPKQRLTVNLELQGDARLANAQVSTLVTSDVPIVAERAMYWPGGHDTWQEAHNSMGVAQPAARWGLSEGRVGMTDHYETYILLANPGTVESSVRVTFLREQGPPVVKQFTVRPTSRFNVNVAYDVPELVDERFGAVIETLDGTEIAVERAMYWDSGGVRWAGGTDTAAVPLP